MKLEDIQRMINSLKAQKEERFAVIMSPKNFKGLLNEMARQNLIIQKEPLMLSGQRIEAWPYFPEDSILCVTKDGYDKLTAKPKMEDLIIFPTKLFEEKAVDCNVIPDKAKVLEWYKKLEKLLEEEKNERNKRN